MDVLVIDIGGSHVKMRVNTSADARTFPSGAQLTPAPFVDRVREATRDWRYDVVAVGFDFAQAFGKPVRIVNDAVMQALGAYDGGRMLFLGLGTGLGSALVSEHVVVPLELGNLPFGNGETIADRIGRRGLERNGKAAWTADVTQVTTMLRSALAADYLVLGGGNAGEVEPLPPATRRGSNEDAFTGGFRLWEELVEPHDRQPAAVWRVIR